MKGVMEMENKTFLMDVSDNLECIEDGINAARAMTNCRGVPLTDDEYINAQAWIYDHLMDDLQTVRASVAHEIGRRQEA